MRSVRCLRPRPSQPRAGGLRQRCSRLDVYARTAGHAGNSEHRRIRRPERPASADAGVVQIEALGIAYTTTAVTAPADTPFKLEFANNDANVPHDVVLKDGAGTEVFRTDVFPGVATKSYDVPALAAGSYPFVCTIHPGDDRHVDRRLT